MLDHALALAARGFAVFPCHTMTAAGCSCGHNPTPTPGLCSCGRTELYGASHGPCGDAGKHPATRHGFKDASREASVIRALWAAAPANANIGIATGAPSGGLQVVDADGPEGLASVAGFPPTLSARTGSGGLHLYYRLAGEQQRNTTRKIAPGVDSRGDGGYVIAPPSRHASGGVYAWVDGDDAALAAPIAELPADILAAMRRRGPRATMGASSPAGEGSSTSIATPADAAAGPAPAPRSPAESAPAAAPAPLPPRAPASGADATEQQRRRRYALAALDGACDDLRRTPNGGKHDAALTKARKIGGFVGSGLLTAAEAERALFSATVAAGWAKEREANTLRAIRDGLRYGVDAPLEPPAPTRSSSAPNRTSTPSDEERDAIREEGAAATTSAQPTQGAPAAPPSGPAVAALLAQVQEMPVLSLKRDKNGAPKNTYANTVAVVRHIYGGAPTNPARRLSFNEMTLTPLVDGEPQREGHDLSALRERIELDHGFAPSAENVKAAVIHVAHEQSFHPVRAYLRSLAWDGVSRLAELSERVLFLRATCDDGREPLHMVFLRKWLLSAVARAFDPGCKVDTALVLYGKQGCQKSGFFRVLAGLWFGDTQMDLSNKDAILQLHSAWIYEWSEIDRITSQKHAGDVKGFVTTQCDTFRAPYAAAVAKHDRSGVIVGSTNKKKFLTDPTGNRRFHVIDVDHLDPKRGQQIDLKYLAEIRDQLWAEVVALYDAGGLGRQHWLTAEEEAANIEYSEQYLVDADPWVEVIERFIAGKATKAPLSPLTMPQDQITTQVLFQALKIDPALQTHAQAIRIGAAMDRLGYESRSVRVHYHPRNTVRMWMPKGAA